MGMGPPADQRGPCRIVTGVVMCRGAISSLAIPGPPPILPSSVSRSYSRCPVMNMLRPSSVPAKHPGLIRLGQNLQREDLGNVFAPDFSVPECGMNTSSNPRTADSWIIDGVAENTGKLARSPYFGMP